LVKSNHTSSSYTPVSLNDGTKYYWKIVAKNSGGNTTGSIWNFTTANQVNPPAAPANPNPANNSTEISKSTSLSWTSTGATSYDIYLGTSSNPPLVKSNHTSSSYTPVSLNDGTKYYWKIVAKNSGGNTTGSIWNFTTAAASDPSGLDFTGPVYSGNTLLVSNESINGNVSENTGTLSMGNTNSEEYSIPRGLDMSAYRIDPKRPIPDDAQTLDLEKVSGPEAVTYTVGDTRQFWTYNFDTGQDELITATLQAQGTYTEVWVKDTGEITQQKAQLMANEFDNTIYPEVTQNFYTPSDVNSDGKVAILCFDIKDGFTGSGGYIGGYFWGGDLFGSPGSNQMEIFYIDTYPSMHYPSYNPIDVSKQYSTLAHEFQHMVSFNRNRLVEGSTDIVTWLDEAFSMAAEHLIYGAQEMEGRVNYYNNSNSIRDGHSLLYWDDSGDTLSNYALSYLFGQYIRIQMNQGNAIYKEIILDQNNDYGAVENAVKKYIDPGMTFGEFMTAYRIALHRKDATGLYGFGGETSFDLVSPRMYTGSGKNIRGGGALMKSIPSSFTESGNEGVNIQYVGIQ